MNKVTWWDNPTRGVVRWDTCQQCDQHLRSTFKQGLCKQCRPRQYYTECKVCKQVLNGPFAMESGLCPTCEPDRTPKNQRLKIWD